MSRFEDVLQECKIEGFGFPVVDRRIAGGYDFARFKPVGTPGQRTHDTGRKPRVFTLNVAMFNGMDPDWYPEGVEQLLSILFDAGRGGRVEYIDPLLGLIDVVIADWDYSENARDRDGGRFSITLEDNDRTEALEFLLQPLADPESQGLNAADEVDQELFESGLGESSFRAAWSGAGVPLTGGELDFSWPTIVGSTASAYFAEAKNLASSIEAVERATERMTRRMDALIGLPEFNAPERWPLVFQSRLVQGAALRALKQRQQAGSVQFRTLRVVAPISLRRLVLDYYGDPSWYDLVLGSNSIVNPGAVPAGTVLRMPYRR